MSQLHDDLISSLRNASIETPVVVNIDGSINSLVLTKLLTDALGRDSVIGLILPNGRLDIENEWYSKALDTCRLTKIKYHIFNIIDTYVSINEYLNQIKIGFNNDIHKVETPSRIRMTVMYCIATMLNGITCSNVISDQSVVSHGDQCCDISPLINCTKSDIDELIEYYKLEGTDE